MTRTRTISFSRCAWVLAVFLFLSRAAGAEEISLDSLVAEALKNNPDIRAAEAGVEASRFRIPQAASLPDPMFMFGYQNEGFHQYTLGKEQGAQWMFSASQTFPFPGKRGIKEEMATRDSEALASAYQGLRLRTVQRVKELYFDLFLAHKTVDLLSDRAQLFSKIEDAALARYSSGSGMQQEVLMAQAEKYMLLEREEMQLQKIRSTEAMLSSVIGRDGSVPLGRPAEPLRSLREPDVNELVSAAYQHSPEVRSKERMVAASEAKVSMARREYYPDFTVNASYFKRGGEFLDMWSLTTTVNIPLYYKTKQRQGVLEAEASLAAAQRELEASRLMLSSAIRDNLSMARTAGRLMELYKTGLIPKTTQDFESALSGYSSGRIDALTVINRLKALIDFEQLYWTQFVEREKALAKIDAIVGERIMATEVPEK